MKLDFDAAARIKALLQNEIKPLAFPNDDTLTQISHGIVLLAEKKGVIVEKEVRRWAGMLMALEAKWHGRLQ